MVSFSEDIDPVIARVGGIADATIDFKFSERAGRPGKKTVLRVRLIGRNEGAMLFVRSAIGAKSIAFVSANKGSTRAVAEFSGESLVRLLGAVARHGVVHRRAAGIALAGLERGDDPGAFREELEKELSATTRLETPSDGAPPAALDGDVAEMAEAISAEPGWLPSFIEGGAIVKPLAEKGGRMKTGCISVNMRGMPRALAAATAIRRTVGAGCVKGKHARVSFSTKKGIAALRKKIGEIETFDFDGIVATRPNKTAT
jgi:hypothetical protein